MEAYAGQQYIGIDLHRRRSVIVRTTDTGDVLEAVQITNSPLALAEVMTRAGEHPEVVLESTYGWYWAVDVLQELSCEPGVHLAHPLGVKAFEYRRYKDDYRDSADLADLLRMGRLPEAWIAPPAVRELRELVRHRAKLVAMRSNCKAEVHAVLAKCGIAVPMSDLFGVGGTQLLDRLELAQALRGADRLAAPGDGPAGLRDRHLRQPGPRPARQGPGVHRGADHPRDRTHPGRGVRRRDR